MLRVITFVGSAGLMSSCEQGTDAAHDAAIHGALPTRDDAAVPGLDSGMAASAEAGVPGNESVVPGEGSLDAGPAGDAQVSAVPLDPSVITYHKNIRAMLETSCRDCHTKGGIGPIPFDDWSSVKNAAPLIVSAVADGTMPPFGWREGCRDLSEDRSLGAAQKSLFAQWKQAGFPEGNAADYKPDAVRPKKELGPPTIVMSMGVAYTPPANADEYRCFVLDAIPMETYLTGMQILPGQAEEVHHVIIHRVDDARLAQARTLDQNDPKPGYVCTGGPGITAQNMFSYRPGSEAVTFDSGDAAYMPAGSSLVIQVHYNTVFLGAGKAPTPDETKIALWTLPAGQLPERVVYRTTTFGPINIPANGKNIVSNISRPMRNLATLGSTLGIGGTFIPGEIIGTTPHAHQLATSMNASLKRTDGTSACLNDVSWDFEWQLDYIYARGVPYGPDDTFTASCTYDNSPENQPIINGMKQTSKAVAFGERSTDEMCEHYIWLRFPRDAFLQAR